MQGQDKKSEFSNAISAIHSIPYVLKGCALYHEGFEFLITNI